MPSAKPTLKTIANLSGLAVPTVSRALNDAPDIGADTKKRVRRIADEIGYIPNRAGVRLRTGRTNVVSLILSTEHDMMNHTARLIASVAGQMRDTPFHLIVTPFFPGEDPMRPVRYVVETGSADAVIINQVQPEDPRVRYLLDQKFPFATHGRSNWSDNHPYADFDNAEFGRISVRKLTERGRKNIVLIAPPQEHSYGQHMIAGSAEAAQEAGVEFRVIEGIDSDTRNRETQEFMQREMLAHPEIDAIISGSSNSVMACVAAAEALGRTLGGDVDIVGKEAISFLKLFRKDLLVVPEDVRQTGEFLADAAIRAIREPDAPPMQWLEVPKITDFKTD